MKSIRAAVLTAPHSPLIIQDVRLAAPRDNELLVELVATGICHSDVAVVEQIMPLPPPIVLGHEGAGIVREVGKGVSGFAPGDPVVLTFSSCGVCPSCNEGLPGYCDAFPALNFGGRRPDGSVLIDTPAGAPISAGYFGQSSFATHALVSSRGVVKVRRDAPLKLLGPLGCGFMTGAGTVVNVLKPKKDATVVIFGTGAVGFAGLLAARLLGCKRVIAVDRVKSRLDLARELGATDVIDTSNTDLDPALASLGGIDVCMDTTGVPAVVEPAIRNLKVRGELVLVGASSQRMMSTDMMHLISGRTIRGAVEGDSEPAKFIPWLVEQFLEGGFPLDKLSRFYPFEQINTAIADGLSGKAVKPILVF